MKNWVNLLADKHNSHSLHKIAVESSPQIEKTVIGTDTF